MNSVYDFSPTGNTRPMGGQSINHDAYHYVPKCEYLDYLHLYHGEKTSEWGLR